LKSQPKQLFSSLLLAFLLPALGKIVRAPHTAPHYGKAITLAHK